MKKLLALAFLFSSQSLFGAEFSASTSGKAVCKLGTNTRRVEVLPGEVDSKASCQVRYFKDQEEPGDGKVLWSASNLEGFCAEKATGFVAKLAGLGWKCEGDLAPKDSK